MSEIKFETAPNGALVASTFNQQFRWLAEEKGEHPAIIDDQLGISFRAFERQTNQLARQFQAEGAGQGDFILISSATPSNILLATAAAWKIGAVPMPISERLVQRELDSLVALAKPALAFDDTERSLGVKRITAADAGAGQAADPLPDVVAPYLKAPTSGGSTGTPKIIVAGAAGQPGEIVALGSLMRVPANGVCLITAALYHNASFSSAMAALASGSTAVLMGRFDAERVLQLIARHRVNWVYTVPTMMLRIWKLPEELRTRHDLSSLETLLHLAAPCPVWLKHSYIEWLGADTVYEIFGPTEVQAATAITGPEWLAHEGSVGKVVVGEISIRNDAGQELPAGETGLLWIRRSPGEPPSYHYIGAEAEVFDDGWETVGDIGYKDAEGYIYLTDRRSDMILVGGVNVYPAEIEAVADQHPDVLSCCCVGVESAEDGGKTPALVIQTPSGQVPDDFSAYLAAQLSRNKMPDPIRATAEPLRDAAGKVRRHEVIARYFPGKGS